MAVEWDRVAKMADARAPRPLVTACAVLAVLSGLLVGVTALRTPVGAATSATDGGTRGADNYRTGWYPDQTELSPSLVGGGTFGQLFDTPVDGEVYGQPLVDDGQLLVNTENNYAYGLDPVTGAILWTREFGAPVLATNIGCADLTPTFGVTSTPVVDQSTDVEYLVDNEYVSGDSGPTAYYMHALNLADNGTEEPGFPVEIQGTASNDPSLTFNPSQELQRPGLLLMNGTVYAAFAAHCDIKPWEGWIAGVTETGTLQTMWTTAATSTDASPDSGAGIWMSGGGLVSDGPGQILFATGNGASNGAGPIPGNTPPPDLGEAVVRVAVQPDGSLKAVDFFSPYDATTLDQSDLDFGSGSPVALPDAYFGTEAIPHLAVAVGKEGYVYLLNRDNLGGVGEGPNGTDDVVGRYGPNGGVWSSPAVWPGDGGYIYIPTASGSVSSSGSTGVMDAYQYGVNGSGTPTLNLVGQSADAFGFGSSAPVVTSDGTAPGSALVWTVWSADGSGAGAQLRAYDPVPVDGVLQLVWSAPVGTSSKFNPPGVADNRLYVGTRDGHVLGFGSPVGAPVSTMAPTFPATVVGQTSTETQTITANDAVTITSLSATGPFTLGTPSQTLPAALGQGASISVPVTFAPTAPGPVGGGLTVTLATSQTITVDLTASGQVDGPSLSSTTNGISFGGIPPDAQASTTVGFVDNGSQPLTISAVDLPAAPFTVSGVPTLGAQLEPGAEVVVNVTFAPSLEGSYASTLELDSTGGNLTVALTGNSTSPAVLSITPTSLDYGSVPVGTTSAESFTVSNTGSANLTITKSKPPATGPFTASTELSEGTTLVPGESVTETVAFTPTVAGAVSDTWIITGDDGSGPRTISLSGTGYIPAPVTRGSTDSSHGYWLVGSDGGIFNFGSAQFHGSTGSLVLQRPVVGIVPTADDGGYWLDAADGGVFSFGDTRFYGSIPGLGFHPAGSGQPQSLNDPIVGMVPSADDGGYFMVGSDGGIFAFGDAHFAGSCPGIGGCAGAAVAVIPDHSGEGYWVVTSTGNTYAFGDAPYLGGPGHGTVTSAVASPDGNGYWILLSDGGVSAYGDATNFGSPPSANFNGLDPATTIFATSDSGGYWVSSAAGAVFNFGDAPNDGGMSQTHLSGPIIAATGF
jgi:iron transport multicopper oxidase